jgi:Uma2 family endonuclease
MVTIQIHESVANRLAAQAKAEGLTIEDYLARVAMMHSIGSTGALPRLTVEEFDRLLDEESSSDSTYQGTFSRADIYLDHD